ncbi:hypothetical protein BABINDRAFT_131885 [Babjeviella inositovora NRRL Y-12698]|uniref:Uncharacterized protein n=1 Tax=Babjeviella inositovora NRRL Y-12698 TaxID=984486 RepID=A0A1E3QRM6_9ASCO|nr:uncharacterized protein BABINDRAFT_131885 [Babjeviella inositovora NRRL Y-12698]ODQ80331.1 hypothetical protein BABINDRAFT_131885 [Babjeviella inositovora NRRL Y-12698]
MSSFVWPDDTDSPSTYGVLKKTLVHSPIIQHIFTLNIDKNKPYANPTTTGDVPATEPLLPLDTWDLLTSQKAWGDDVPDSFDDGLFDNYPMETTVKRESTAPREPAMCRVQVVVRAHSLTVDGATATLPVRIKTCAIIPGAHGEVPFDDSLFVSLNSGVLLLVRIYYTGDGYTPRVVQWMGLDNKFGESQLYDVGHALAVHRLGLYAATTAMCCRARVVSLQRFENGGIAMKAHHDLYVDGTIVHTVFMEPLDGNPSSVMLLLFVVTNERRLQVRTYQWSLFAPFRDIHQYSPYLVPRAHALPVRVVPLCQNNAVLLVLPDRLVLLTIHQILNAGYDATQAALPGFVSAVFHDARAPMVSRVNFVDYDRIDEIFLATDNGRVHAVVVKDKEIECTEILNVGVAIDTFTLTEFDETHYLLSYGAALGTGREVKVSKAQIRKGSYDLALPPLPQGSSKHRSHSSVVREHPNWASMRDYRVGAASNRNIEVHSSQELWGLSGNGAGTALNHIRVGYRAVRTILDAGADPLELFRVLCPDLGELLVYSGPFETRIVSESDADLEFELASRTLLVDKVGALWMQVTEDTVVLTNLHKTVHYLVAFADSIRFAALSGTVLVVVTDSQKLEAFEIDVEAAMAGAETVLIRISAVQLELQVAVLKVVVFDKVDLLASGRDILVGTFESELVHFRLESTFVFVKSLVLDGIPNDLFYHAEQHRLYVGSRTGMLAKLREFALESSVKISETPVTFYPNLYPDTLVILARNIWVLRMRDAYPWKVLVSERSTSRTYSLLPLATEGKCLSVLAVRDEGVSRLDIDLSETAVVLRTIPLGVPARTFIHHEKFTELGVRKYGIFVVLTTKLLCVDPKSLCTMSHREMKSNDEESIFSDGESPLSVAEWCLNGHKNLIVGCTKGNEGCVKVIQVSKTREKGRKDVMVLKKLNSWKVSDPVYALAQLSDFIAYAAGCALYLSSYNLATSTMNPAKKLALFPSNVIAISCQGTKVVVTTQSNSFKVFCFDPLNQTLQTLQGGHGSSYLLRSVPLNDTLVTADQVTHVICGFDLAITGGQAMSRFKNEVDFVPRLALADFFPIWLAQGERMKVSGNRFIACGVGGEIVCYTLLKKAQYSHLNQLIRDLKALHVDPVGFWALDDPVWLNEYTFSAGGRFGEDDRNVLDCVCLPEAARCEPWVNDLVNSVAL